MSSGTGQLLFDEPPIAVSPSLIRSLGLPEAVLLQQVHFRIWCKRNEPAQYVSHFIDGRYWVHWSLAELQKAVPLGGSSQDPYKRVIKRLKLLGILLVEQHRRSEWNRTNWYSISYESLHSFLSARAGSDARPTGGKATDRDTVSPLVERSFVDPSTGGKSSAVSQSESSSETSLETTTAKQAATADGESLNGGGEDIRSRLDLSALPAAIQSDVQAIVATRRDAQRFVDLLSARLERNRHLPPAQQLKNPVLWLRSLFERIDAVDFNEADRVRAERDRSMEHARRQMASVAAAVAESVRQDAAALRRRQAAEEALAQLTQDEREALTNAALASTSLRSQRTKVKESIATGRLPDSPLARLAVIRALEAFRDRPPGAAA